MNKQQNHKVYFQHLGLMHYKKAWDYQEELFQKIIDIKMANRSLPPERQEITPNYLLFCQHPHVYTLGKSGDPANLLIDEKGLREREASFYRINRGGDITYHGPGQIVGYPIFDLDNFYTDIHQYLRMLEEAIILTLKDFGLEAGRIKGLTGVWLDREDMNKARKICAIGVRTSRWVTMHGFAFNVLTDLSYFDHIVPCGIDDKAVTSLEKELDKRPSMEEVEEKLKHHIEGVFQLDLEEMAP